MGRSLFGDGANTLSCQLVIMARSLLRYLGSVSREEGLELSATLEKQGFADAFQYVLAGWATASPAAAWRWFIANKLKEVGGREFILATVRSGPGDAATEIDGIARLTLLA